MKTSLDRFKEKQNIKEPERHSHTETPRSYSADDDKQHPVYRRELDVTPEHAEAELLDDDEKMSNNRNKDSMRFSFNTTSSSGNFNGRAPSLRVIIRVMKKKQNGENLSEDEEALMLNMANPEFGQQMKRKFKRIFMVVQFVFLLIIIAIFVS